MEDRALGCLLGVAEGDAAGGPLEGRTRHTTVTPRVALEAMHMPGSTGRHYLGRGQTTDDTELTISLARGLVGHPPSAGFPIEAVAREYSCWHAMGAYRGGRTCRRAFSVPPEPDPTEWSGNGQRPSLATRMQARARHSSMGSKANGALMRAAPLAVWGHRLDPLRLAADAAADASLSHPNPTCADCSAAYCIAGAHLVASPDDAAGAVARACEWAERSAGAEVRQWLLRHSQQLELEELDCLASAGFVKHAFTLAFWHLRRRTPFVEGIQQTLCRGGDTDTNAAIVGGLLGALWGASAIPAWMQRPVLEYGGRQTQGGGRWRPPELRAARLPDLAHLLCQGAGN